MSIKISMVQGMFFFLWKGGILSQNLAPADAHVNGAFMVKLPISTVKRFKLQPGL